jgi:membrane fusion protein, adhesin transport system
MLNITDNTIRPYIKEDDFKSYRDLNTRKRPRAFARMLKGTSLAVLILMFIPWTQNIRSRGLVTALNPDQRPQSIHSVIAGQINKWFVQEGDFVKKGDTILFISEIKDEYFDPQLLTRTKEQLQAKEMSVKSYMEKVKALDNQIDALTVTGKLKFQQALNKVEQAKLKVQSDSIDYQAKIINYETAKEQYKRMEQLYEQGLKSKTDL